MSLKDLITGPDDRLSHLKIWSNIAYASGTIVFLWQGFHHTLTSDIFLLYMGTVGGAHILSKLIDTRNTNNASGQ